MADVVPVLQRLRWGKHGFANLRYGPNEQLDWTCDVPWYWAPCDFTGGEVRPGDLESLRDGPLDDPTLVGSQDTATVSVADEGAHASCLMLLVAVPD